MNRDDETKQAIGAVAKLGGFTIKRIATSDDLKDRVLTITLTRVSDGWVQQRMDFEDEPAVLVTVDGNNGHVENIDIVDPSDLTETDETQATSDPDEGLLAAEGLAVATTAPTGASTTIVDLDSKKRR